MRNTGRGYWAGAGVILLAIAYSVILFLLKKDFNLSTWVLFAFTIIAFICLFLQCVVGLNGNHNEAFSAASLMITIVYCVIQFVFGGLICMFFDIEQSSVVLVAEVIVLVLYLIALFALNGAHDDAQKQDIADSFAVQTIYTMEAEVRNLSDAQEKGTVKDLLNELADDLHYMNAMDNKSVKEQEERIKKGIGIIRYKLENGDDDIEDVVFEVRNTINERSRIAAIVRH